MAQAKIGGFTASAQTNRQGMELNDEIMRHGSTLVGQLSQITDLEGKFPLAASNSAEGNIANGVRISGTVQWSPSGNVRTITHTLGRTPVGVVMLGLDVISHGVGLNVRYGTLTGTTFDVFGRSSILGGGSASTTAHFWVF